MPDRYLSHIHTHDHYGHREVATIHRWLRPHPSLYYGWVLVVTLGITTIISYGTTQYLFGVLVVPISETFHWNRGSISGANALNLLISGFLGVPIGYMIDSRGSRLLMTLGSLIAGSSLISMAFMQNIWQFYSLWAGGIGIAMALILYPVTFTVITSWFERKRARALALLTLVGGLASPIFIPLAGLLISHFGWRTTVFIFGTLHLLLAMPLHAGLLRRHPEELGLSPDGIQPAQTLPSGSVVLTGVSVREAVRHAVFWSLTISFALAMLGNSVLLTHQVAHMISRGYDSVLAATLTGGLGLASLPGRFFLNMLSERISSQKLLAYCHFVQALGIIALILAPSVGWLVLYVLLYGAAFGAIAPLRATIMADHFGRRAYGAITALQGCVTVLCTATGPLAAGWLYDQFGRYDIAFWLCVCGMLLSALGVFFTPPPTHTLS